MGRPKKRPQFDQEEPWALMQAQGGVKFIVQKEAYFSYAEQRGAFVEEIKARRLEPHPQFIMWKEEYETKEQYDKLSKTRVEKTIAPIRKKYKVFFLPNLSDVNPPIIAPITTPTGNNDVISPICTTSKLRKFIIYSGIIKSNILLFPGPIICI